MEPIDAVIAYANFVPERHRVWVARRLGAPGPWTVDPVLASRKFTNMFRWLDPGTQYVLKDLADGDPGEPTFLARCLLYRQTNEPRVWRRMNDDVGLPTIVDLKSETHGRNLFRYLDDLREREGYRIFRPAYIVYPGPSGEASRGTNKIRTVIDRTREALRSIDFRAFSKATLEEQVNALRANRGIGDFIAQQTVTDFNYLFPGSRSENDFVVAGPGARRGAKLLEPGKPAESVIAEWREFWEHYGPRVEGRPLSLMDVQNTMCEFSKYARYLTRNPGKPYEPEHPGKPEPIVMPKGTL